MNNRIPFQKPYTNAYNLVKLLQSRGLTINDTDKAERYLDYIGYYRLSAYMYPLLQTPKEQHQYKPNASFAQVMNFLNIISPQNDMKTKIKALLTNYPAIDIAAMGFPANWQQEPLWQV